MTQFLRPLFACLAIAFTIMIGWASLRGDFGAEFAALTTMPWGKVSLTDLYLGFLLYGCAVWLIEDKLSNRLLWALPVIVLGNAWSLIWVAVRFEHIAARLTRK
ncbi:MAG: hypothetical protein RL186_644 [Pseudomonadota bacterium]